ncbi:ATP-dependent DNA helicase PIF1 [Triplophysa tibetana]|uniref:ATP-dependent DNA helicase n=1 Tax=Triplophysa tibetana TaxID=1572043 RepID=A0A5A9MWZ7_9TELE|nr:ATP-dependent DNA helicase PIF1 [Triplophysa tibetana]
MPRKKGFRMRRTPRAVKSKNDVKACICSEKLQVPVVAGTDVRNSSVNCDVNVPIACGVAAAIKSVIDPVCTWIRTDIDELCLEGSKLVPYIAVASQKRDGKEKDLCKFIDQLRVFGREWNVVIGPPTYRDYGLLEEDNVMYEELQEYLLRDRMCLLNLHSSVSVIIHHEGYFVMVDFGTRDVFGLASDIGTPVAVFNTSLDDLMFHINNLRKSLDAQWYGISSISVKAGQKETEVQTDTLFTDSNVEFENADECDISSSVRVSKLVDGSSVRLDYSVRGSFHQGNDLFEYGGLQCMAIALVSLAKHTVDSVFSWQTKHVDRVLVLGDQMYTSLRDTNKISHPSKMLAVPDLPKETVIEGQSFLFQYGDMVCGDVDMVEGELIQSGVCVSLLSGLEKMFPQYDTCLLTLCDSTCAVISRNGQYALVDSHARSATGMVDGNGRSVVVYFSSLENLFHHICNLATTLTGKQKPFEIASVCISVPTVKPAQQNAPKLKNASRTKRLRVTDEKDKKFEMDFDFDTVNEVPVNDERNKCKISASNCTSKKKRKINNVVEVNSDVEFVSDVVSENMMFSPISRQMCQNVCTRLKVDFVKPDFTVFTRVGILGVPCKKDSIVADGNCYFRAISQAVSGTQKYHRKIRLAVVQQLKENNEKYRNILRREYSSVSEYINKSRMQYVNNWATEVEIQATADYLGIDVFTLHDARWLKYSCNGKRLSKHGIYLENCFGNHYESVVCVNDPELSSCYGYCKTPASIIEGYNIRSNIKNENIENKEPFIDVQMQFEAKQQHRGVLKRTQNDTCCAVGMITDSEFEVLENAHPMTFTYSPLSTDVAQILCNTFKLDLVKENVQVSTIYGSLGVICKTDKVVKDASSFFRAVALFITGSQKSHRKIRLAVVKYMESEGEEHMKLVGKEFASMSEYISKSQMKYVGSSASDIEIQGTANALGVNLFICNGGIWVKYSCMSTLLSSEGIYLKQCENNNFEPVICVQHAHETVCFDLCKKKRVMEMSRKKYRNDVFHKKRVMEMSRKKYRNDVFHKKRVMEMSRKKYRNDVFHKKRVMEMSRKKYRNDVFHKKRVMEMSRKKYRNDVFHKKRVMEMSRKKYRNDVFHKKRVMEMSRKKYRNDVVHKNRLKEISRKKYLNNVSHREKIKAFSTKKYHKNPEHKKRVKAGVKLRRQQIKLKAEQFDFVMQQFLDLVKDGPDFVCCVCQRLLFKHQVLKCKRDYYFKKGVASTADKCITEEYLHKCNKTCVMPCQWLDTARGMLWICYTCHYKLNKDQMPVECATNNLRVDPIPPELACLNSLEQHLIALHLPFMKMLALPKGGQNGVHGPVTCVPANIVQTSNLLPLSSMQGSLLPVKLKRKLTYKGHYKYQFVDSMHIRQALKCLKQINVHYKDVEFNEVWLNEFCREGSEVVGKESDAHVEHSEASVDAGEDELLHDRQQHCMFQDTCLMPVDIGQEALDQYFDNVLNVAPAEGNNPVRLLSDLGNEAKCFPVLFPMGCNTYHGSRDNRLTLSRYFNNRILHADGRFAQNVEYIFFAQYMSEIEQVMSNVSIALRKGRGGCVSQKVDENVLNNEESLKKLLEFDDGYRFLKPIRGTPAFWQGAQRDLLACVRQLGVPTFFSSFSSADMRWKNLLDSILKQEGRTQTVEELQWADRCELLRRNPVTAARMFDYRWHCFLREVLMSSAHPIGKIKDYFYRVEFQQRGSPHVHCLFWIENAPVIDKNTDEEVIQFIDKYVTCELPSQDDTLLDIVTSVQQHSKRHSKTCKKKNTVCRFNFPRPASARTFICRGKSDAKKKCMCEEEKTDDLTKCACVQRQSQKDLKMKREQASEILSAVKKALSDENSNYDSVEHLFQHLGINQATFEVAYKSLNRNTHVVLKRQVNEVWVNPYSKPLLKCWNANLDIQFVVDAFACVVYIISYISKSEREMGLLLGNTQREARKDGNTSAKDALKQLGSVYLHNREVCAQESVYRLTNMHLKECSRKVVFVPTGDNIVKMSLPLKVLRQKATSRDLTTEEMWMTSIVDRYKNRPEDLNDICMATFASEYRVLSKNEKSRAPLKLNNGCGFITKRTRTQPAVIRYARFSKETKPESFYQSIMQLFLPYRVDLNLKPPNFETYEQFYMNGHVTFTDGSGPSVRSVVDFNRKKFEKEAEELDDIQNTVESNGVVEDSWCELCPELELERLLCVEEMKDKNQLVEKHVENIPDLASNNQRVAHFEKKNNVMCRSDGLALIRSLNETQQCIFYQIRQWCLDKITGNNPKPLHVFITGGAGTGKSHLIKAIQYEAMRLLSTGCRQPDNICVLLTAPTGIAAYNLHAATIHNTFSIGIDVRLPYTPLGEDKLNCLRAKYNDLQILIIDEISMVDQNLFAYIHGRLRQIKQSGDFSPFGNVSIIAVGDFFQLPPVKGIPLYSDNIGVNFWSTLFSVVELKTIVRQKDNTFAELLNRLRIRTKGTPMLKSDIDILKKCETGEVSSCLHIFPTNRQVNEHNVKQLIKSCPEHFEIHAQDFKMNKKNGKLEMKSAHHAKTYNTCLEETLLIGKGARVMLTKNVDVIDGLVNGACGTVTDIVYPDNEIKFPKTVYVKFEDNEVGAQRRKCCTYAPTVAMGSTGIKPEEERVNNKGQLRRQFPLKLAWACTVHKVQGISVDEAVVSLKKIFAPGQAYVALSRVRSLSGLIIQDFEEKAIYCKDSIKDAIQRMPTFGINNIQNQKVNTQTFNVFLINVQSLRQHLADLVSYTLNLQPNCIAVTETWLPENIPLESVKINGYSFHSHPRSVSYSSSNPTLTEIQAQQHGGVGMYTSDGLAYDVVPVPNINLECLVCNYTTHNILIAVIYRPPSYPMSLFKENLGKLLDFIEHKCHTTVLMGDFNDNILKSLIIYKFITERGFVQHVTQTTTEKGTLIDHVYVKTTHYDVEARVLPTYFSDHEGILCSFTKSLNNDHRELDHL